MARDLRGTKLEQELFAEMGDFYNPNAQLFTKLFGKHKDRPERYRTDDIINIGPEQSEFVAPDSMTQIGIYMVNKFILNDLKIFGYVNKLMDGKVWGSIESGVATALAAGDLTSEQVFTFIDKTQFLLGGPLAHLINPSINKSIMILPPAAKALKKELFKKYEAELANNDPQVASEVEQAITAEAIKDIERTNDPSLSFFKSGAIDPYNNYKTMFVMKGAVRDNTGESPTGFKVVTSNYDDGISKEDMPKIADTLVFSAYSSGVATQDSGTDAKKLNAVFQRIELQDIGTDCGSKECMKTVITTRHIYRYILDGGKLIKLTPENIDQYKGKVCNLRTPIHCHAPDPNYCSVCVGERPYRIGIHNIGLTLNNMSGSTLNAALKTKHDVRVKYRSIGIDDLMKYVY